MKNRKLPVIITTKDLQRITGWSLRHCQNEFAKARKAAHKGPRGIITRREICVFIGLTDEDLYEWF